MKIRLQHAKFWLGAALSLMAGVSIAQVGSTKRIPQQVAVDYFFPFTATTTIDMSADGRYVVFETTAALLSTDQNGAADIYRFDRTTSGVEIVSLAKDNTPTGQGSEPAISADGRYVAFNTTASNMVTLPLVYTGIVVRDMQTSTNFPICLTAANATANGGHSRPRISGDGRFVVFTSSSTNLTTGDTNGQQDIFLRDRTTNTTVRASEAVGAVGANGLSDKGFVSDNGRFVTFESAATNLIATDTNGQTDIFRKDLTTGTVDRVNLTSTGTALTVASSLRGAAADGNRITWRASSSAIVPGGPTSAQLYLRDVGAATTSLVSLLSDGSLPTSSQNITDDGTISKNGRYITFTSTTDGYIASDTNGASDAIMRDLNLGKTTRVSVRFNGTQTAGVHSIPIPSNDGRYVGFMSVDQQIIPGDSGTQKNAFVRDTQANTNVLVDRNQFGNFVGAECDLPSLSNDGRFTAFKSPASNLVTNDTNGIDDVFLYDRTTDGVTMVSLSALGQPGDAASTNPRISGDGTWIAFETTASNLEPPGSTVARILMRNRATLQTIVVSKKSTGQPDAGLNASLSFDGRYIAFESATKLIPEDTNNFSDIYVYDRVANNLKLVSVSTSGAVSNGASRLASISSDGNRVAFESDATNLVPFDLDAQASVFVRDISLNTTICASLDAGGIVRNGTLPKISGNGATLVFQSVDRLIADSPATVTKIFLRDLSSGQLRLVGVNTSNAFLKKDAFLVGVSTDGNFVCFNSTETTLPSSNGKLLTYLEKMDTRDFTLCSKAGSTPSDQAITNAGLAADVGFVSFRTNSKILVAEPIQFQTLFLYQFRDVVTSVLTGTCQIESYGGPRPLPALALTLEPTGGGSPVNATASIASNGTFSTSVGVTGNYRVYAKTGTTLRKLVGTFNLTGASTALGTFLLKSGDCDDDNSVSIIDYSILSDAFDSAPGGLNWDPRADLDFDNGVTIIDYSILSDNFDLAGE